MLADATIQVRIMSYEPNRETSHVITEVAEGKNVEGFNNMDNLFKLLDI